MFDPKELEALAKKLATQLPEQFGHLQDSIQQQFKTVLQSTFERLNLVTREEFDVQLKVLARTREKVEQLETQLRQLQK